MTRGKNNNVKIEAKNFLLFEENEKLKERIVELEKKEKLNNAELLQSKDQYKEALDFICSLTGPAEELAVEFLTRKIKKVCGL